MTSWTSLSNMALIRLGVREISSLDDPTPAARKIKSIYEALRDEVLYSHPWKVALRRTFLSSTATAPVFGPSLAYNFPTDPYCLRIWRVGDDEDHWFSEGERWEIEGRQILTDMPGPLKVRFIAQITDEAQFAGLVGTAMARRIEAEIAYTLTNSREKEEKAWNDYGAVLIKAQSLDSQQGSAETAMRSEILESRY